VRTDEKRRAKGEGRRAKSTGHGAESEEEEFDNLRI